MSSAERRWANMIEPLQRTQALLEGQRQFLELLATGGTLPETLDMLVRLLETQWPGMLGLVLLLDEEGTRLYAGAYAGLPAAYVDAWDGIIIGPEIGSCGTACYTRQRVVVNDIVTDPRWASLRDLAVAHGLAACWSEPMLTGSGRVLGSFAMYYREPRAPTQAELDALQTAAHLAGVAIEHKRAEQELRKSEARFRAVFRSAAIGMMIADLEGQVLEANPALQRMLGYSTDELRHMRPTDRLHPEDVAAWQTFQDEAMTRLDRTQYEARYYRRDGGLMWGRFTYSAARDEHGGLLYHIGMLEDITRQKQAESALQAAYQTLERRVSERTRELSALNAVAEVVSRSLDLHEVLRGALRQVLEVVDTGSGAIYALDQAAQEFVLVAQQGLSPEFVDLVTRLPVAVALAGRSFDAAGPLVWSVADYPDGPIRDGIVQQHLTAIVAVPLLAKERLAGALVFSPREPRDLTAEEAAMLMAVGRQVGVAIENARLYEQAEQAAAAAERNRLARELHDSVTQNLYSVTLYAEAAARLLAAGKEAQAADHVRVLRDTAQEALREMRLLIFELRPLELKKIGLAAAIQTRLQSVEARGGMQAELHQEGAAHVALLPLVIQHELYYITQEALNNALKHSRAARVDVWLACAPDRTRLEVVDDGIGFDPSCGMDCGGMGLSNMQERARRLGGVLRIDSTIGQGTRVLVDVPA